MTTARRLVLVFIVYLAADFVDASAPGVFFFDSAFFFGTVVQSKARSADAAEPVRDGRTEPRSGSVAIAGDRGPIPPIARGPDLATAYAPLARNATSDSPDPAPVEDA